jgi:spore coat polysaccharide biosynthesis protein SpsF
MIIVQARMGSKRLPGKVMKEINGKPLIGYLLDRVEGAATVVLLLAVDRTTPLDSYLASRQQWRAYWPGPEDDVAGRFRDLLRAEKPEYFVRLCGDSPLLDRDLLHAAVELFCRTDAMLVSNPRYPHGQQVEVIDTQYFLEREPLMTEPQDREHVTPYLYRNAAPGEWVEFHCNRDMRFDVSMAVDTQADFDRMERVIKRMDRPHTECGWRECMQLAWEEANG